MNWSALEVADVWPATVTVTSTVPLPAGAAAVQLVVDEHDTLPAAFGPKSTVVAPAVVEKPVPVMVTDVPVSPLLGEMAVTVGAGL